MRGNDEKQQIIDEYEREIIDMRKEICNLKNENNSLSNTLNEYSVYKQKYNDLQNDIFSLKVEKQNLIGLRDALNRRIVEIEDENTRLRKELSNIN